MKLISVVGARPNFMKIAPFVRAINKHNAQVTQSSGRAIEHVLVHTGQHYDDRMSRSFFTSLGLPEADVNLGIGSGSHAEQVGRTMIAFESVLREVQPDWVIVVGDVNATCACSITAKKECVQLAHIEAGLRSFDMQMPEEINRLVTDRLSDLLLAPDQISCDNLRAEGVPEEKIKCVGNIMIDTLEHERSRAERLDLQEVIGENLVEGQADADLSAVRAGQLAVVTMHRPANVDRPEVLRPIVEFLLDEVSQDMPVVWPVHPRTRAQLEEIGIWSRLRECRALFLLHPLGYHAMLKLNTDARIMLTDSGGVQEECCVLGTPCLTLRPNTERPITLEEHGGASRLVGHDLWRIREGYREALNRQRQPVRPPLWDGHTAERIVDELLRLQERQTHHHDPTRPV